MSFFIFSLSPAQFQQLRSDNQKQLKALEDIRDELRLSSQTTTEGFNKVAEAISNLQIPEPPLDDHTAVKGTIMARYRLNEDVAAQNPNGVEFDIVGTGFQSAAGTPVGAGDIDLSAQSTSPNVTVEVSNQALSEDGNSVSAHVKLTGATQQPTQELAVVKYSATNRDTGAEVAADIDEFETGPGEASIGTIDSPVPLPEV